MSYVIIENLVIVMNSFLLHNNSVQCSCEIRYHHMQIIVDICDITEKIQSCH